MEQIEALKRTRKIIRDDLMDHFTYGRLSNNWVQWWWNAVVSVYCEFRNTSLAEMDLYKKIDYDHFMEWVDFLDKSETRYKDVRQERDLLPDLEKRCPKLLEPNYESFPLLPNEEKPTVTTLDMVFYELLGLWQYSIWRLSRLAAVDGQVENPEDILSPREYMEYQSINDLRTCTQTSQDEKKSAFKKAVQETNEELHSDRGRIPEQGLDEGHPDYDDMCKRVELPPEEIETIIFPQSKLTRNNIKGKKPKPTIDHIMMDEDKAKKLYRALTDKNVDWLMEPKDEYKFVNHLTSKPVGNKIKLKSLNQIYYIAKHYLFPPQNEKKKRNIKNEEWGIIKQIFDSEEGNITNVDKAYKKPQNYEKLDALMRKKNMKS